MHLCRGINPRNPEKEENVTAKAEVAAAFLVSYPIHIRRGAIMKPPPIPRRPATKPAMLPIIAPIIARFLKEHDFLRFWFTGYKKHSSRCCKNRNGKKD